MVEKKVRAGAIIQARLGSERLPGKALLPLPFGGGPALLEHVVQRAKAAETLAEVVVATTKKSQDDALYSFCQNKGIRCVRGDAEDVLSRFVMAAEMHQLDVVVRLTGDNPCIFPEIIDQTINSHLQAGADYSRTEGLPLGTNIEVISFPALARAYTEAHEAAEREHVTPYFYLRGQHLFKNSYLQPNSFIAPATRLTIDYPSDYALLSLIFEKLYSHNPLFNLRELEELLEQHPWLTAINSVNQQRKVNLTEKEEFGEATKLLQQAGLPKAATFIQKQI